MTNFSRLERVCRDIALLSRAALTPSAATAPSAAEPAPRPPAKAGGEPIFWWENDRDFRGCWLWMADTGRANCCEVGDYFDDPGSFLGEFLEWERLGKPRRPLR